MSDGGGRWSEVGDQIEALALKLRLHFQQAGHGEQAADALGKVRDAVSEAFEAAGNAVRDDAVKADVRETGRLFLEAMSGSLAKAAERMRDKTEPPQPGATAPQAEPEPPHHPAADPKPADPSPDDLE